MNNTSETASSDGEWDYVDRADGDSREIAEPRETVTVDKEECEKLVAEFERLKKNEMQQENEALRHQLKMECELTTKYKKEISEMRQEVEKLKKKKTEEETKQEEEILKASEPDTDESEEHSTTIEKMWMKRALKELKESNAEIEEITANLFKSFAQQEAVAMRRAMPCNIGKTMKQLNPLENECGKYVNGIEERNKKQLKDARAMVVKSGAKMATIAEMDDKCHLAPLSKEAVEILDGHLKPLSNITYLNDVAKEKMERGLLPFKRKLEKCDNEEFYKETWVFKDGGRIVCKWRPDNVLREGIRVVLEKGELNVYCISGKLLRIYYNDRSFSYKDY